MRLAAIIPTRFHPPQLEPLVALLEADGVGVHVMESAQYGHRIYRMWNAGVELAEADFIAVLNDDITILPGSMPLMAEALSDPSVGIVYPDVRVGLNFLPSLPLTLESTTSTWGAAGMTGFCFMFRPPAKFDESYSWWYGDDDFEERTRLSGLKVCRIVGLPIGHSPDGSAGRVMHELGPLIQADRALWDSRHGAPSTGSSYRSVE